MSLEDVPVFVEALEKEARHLQVRARQFHAAYGHGVVVFRFCTEQNSGELEFWPHSKISAASLANEGFPKEALELFTGLSTNYNPLTEYVLVAATFINGKAVEVEGTTGQYLDLPREVTDPVKRLVSGSG